MPENASHTPGPLHTVEYETPYAETRYAVNRGSETLATGIRKEADAKLYAAAPDLLAALQQMRRQFDTYRRTHEQAAACAAAAAAIARALTGNERDAAIARHAAEVVHHVANAAEAVHPVADAAAEAAFASPAPAPGADATTADGRFISGSGYGGERM